MARKKNDLSIKEKLYRVLEFLEDPANEMGICQSDYARMFGTSRNSFLNFVKDSEINRLGYEFCPCKVGRITYYKLLEKPDIEEHTYLEKKDYFRYCILAVLRQHPEGMYLEAPSKRADRLSLPDPKSTTSKREYLFDYFNFIYSTNSADTDGLLPMPLSETRVRAIIEEMVNEGLLLKRYTGRNGYSYSVAYDDVRQTFEFSDDILLDLYNKISQLPPGRTDHDSLQSILGKLAQIRGMATPGDDSDNYLIYGRKYTSLQDIHKSLKRLSEYPFMDYKLIIDDYLFSVGAVVYIEEKDSLFLIGLKEAGEEKTYHSIDTATIHSISTTNQPNLQYSSQNQSMYTHWLNQMFSIGFASGRNPIIVNAHFTDICKVDWKLRRLKDVRGNMCSITRCDDADFPILYTDTVRDTDTLLSFIARFGKACRVDTDSLHEQVKEEAMLTLKEYEEAGYDIKQNL